MLSVWAVSSKRTKTVYHLKEGRTSIVRETKREREILRESEQE